MGERDGLHCGKIVKARPLGGRECRGKNPALPTIVSNRSAAYLGTSACAEMARRELRHDRSAREPAARTQSEPMRRMCE